MNTKTRSNFNIMRRLSGLVKPLTLDMMLAVSLGILGFLCAIFITVLGGSALLNSMGAASGTGITVLSMKTAFLAAGVCAVLRGFLRYGEQACNHYIAFKLLALIRDKVFQALRRLCPAKLEGRDKGDLISVITSDIELLEVFYAHTISPVLIAFFTSLIMVLFIGSYHPLLGLIAATAYAVIGIAVPLLVSKATKNTGMALRSQAGALSAYMLDSLRGLREIMQYNQGNERLRGLDERTDALSGQEARQKHHAGINMAGTNTLILLFDLLMLAAAALLYRRQAVGFDGVLIPFIAMMSSFGPVSALAGLGSTLQNTFAAGSRVLDILDETPAAPDIVEQKEIAFTKAAVKNVTFSYGQEGSKPVLSDISLDIPQGRVIGISGPSGCGKSTLLKLLMRFWPLQKGRLEISDTDINRINTGNLRNMQSFVTQETHLFHDSILNNIRIAKPDASREEVATACRKASLHSFIMGLPKGYDTPVGELGETLSGGERQRIGLARAFLHDAPFILLDEPTSNLDSLNEAVILKSLHEERSGKTMVLVSHRTSTMKIADEVYRVSRQELGNSLKSGRVSG